MLKHIVLNLEFSSKKSRSSLDIFVYKRQNYVLNKDMEFGEEDLYLNFDVLTCGYFE